MTVGWTCSNCGAWVPSQSSHQCYATPSPGGGTVTIANVDQSWMYAAHLLSIATGINRIATALETLIEGTHKEQDGTD